MEWVWQASPTPKTVVLSNVRCFGTERLLDLVKGERGWRDE